MRHNRKRLVKLFQLIGPLLLFGIGVELIDRQRDDDHMPNTNRSGIEIERATSPVTPWTVAKTTYTSYPLIEESGLTDIQEGLLNGPEGYAYFAAAPARKTGALPETLGGRSGWSTDAWASNLQGPVKVQGKTEHVQWEWTAKGELQKSGDRPYPFLYGVSSAIDADQLKEETYEIFEHDEDFWWNPWGKDDYIGTITIDHGACKSQVFDRGMDSGWTGELTAKTSGYVSFLRYRLFCYRTEPAVLK
jgi:hypothetical protein